MRECAYLQDTLARVHGVKQRAGRENKKIIIIIISGADL